jgi:hypothetical protein
MTTAIVVVTLSVQPIALVLIGKMAHIARILLLQLLAHLAPRLCLNLCKLMVLEASVVLTSLVDWLDVLRESL